MFESGLSLSSRCKTPGRELTRRFFEISARQTSPNHRCRSAPAEPTDIARQCDRIDLVVLRALFLADWVARHAVWREPVSAKRSTSPQEAPLIGCERSPAAPLSGWRSVSSGSAWRCALNVNMQHINRMACRHYEVIALRASEAHVGAAFGQPDTAKQLARWIPYCDSGIAEHASRADP